MESETKNIIIKNALELFYQKGFDATGVQEIALKSEVTKPTLYHYFGSKNGLLATILEKYNNILISSIKDSCKYEGDLYWSLYSFASNLFQFAANNRQFYSMQLAMWFSGEKSPAHEAVKPYLKKIHTVIEGLFIDASNSHGNLKGNHQLYSITFIGMLNAYITALQSENIELNEQICHKAVQQFMHGIFAL